MILKNEKKKKNSFHLKYILFQNDFSEDFFEVLHISVGPKMKVLETRPDFLTFSAKTQKLLLKSSNFELQKCYAPQYNPQKNRHKSHV